MLTSFIYALLSSLFAGLYSFLLKVSAEKKYNPSEVIMYSHIPGMIISIFLLVYYYDGMTLFYMAIILSFINGFFYFLASLTRIESLKFIHTTIYFPIYKTIGPIFVLLISLFYFGEGLTIYEFIGIALGVIIPLLLISKKENERQNNLKKGLLLLLVGAIFTAITASAGKTVMNQGINIYAYMFGTMFFGFIFSMLNYKRDISNGNTYNKKHIKRIGLINGIFYFGGVYCFVNALTGNLAVVYTINSFSILIPIFLSIIIYKEHFNFRKGLAIVLTIASLMFFK